MIDKNNIEKTNAWPFVEAKKFFEREKIYRKKRKNNPSNWIWSKWIPHIGTFGEVARTSMVVNALKSYN